MDFRFILNISVLILLTMSISIFSKLRIGCVPEHFSTPLYSLVAAHPELYELGIYRNI